MILNLTQHLASPDQLEAGILDLSASNRKILINLLTVESIPSTKEVLARCHDIAELAIDELIKNKTFGIKPSKAMIGGAPAMMRPLEDALLRASIEPVYAFSVRSSVDQVMPDGSVQKTAVFKHAGFWPTVKSD